MPTPFDNGPFGHILAEPAVQPPTTLPSGFQGTGGTIAQFASNILAGASQGRLRAQAKQEQVKQQNHERLAGLGQMIERSDLQPQIKNNLMTQVGQRMLEQVAYADNGSKGSKDQPKSMGDHAFDFLKGTAQSLIGGAVNKAKPIDEKEILGIFDQLHKPENTIQAALYGPGGHNEQLQKAITDLQTKNPMYDRSAIASHQGVQQALSGYARLGVAPPKFYEEFLGNSPKTPQEALQYAASRQAGSEFMPPPAAAPAAPLPAAQPAYTPVLGKAEDAQAVQTGMAAAGFTPEVAAAAPPVAQEAAAAPPAQAAAAPAAQPPKPPGYASSKRITEVDRQLGNVSKTATGISVDGKPGENMFYLQDRLHPERLGYYRASDGTKVEGTNFAPSSAANSGPKIVLRDVTLPSGLIQTMRFNTNDPNDKGTPVAYGKQHANHVITDPVTGEIKSFSTAPTVPEMQQPPAPPAATPPAAPAAPPQSKPAPAMASKNPEYDELARSEAKKLGLDPETFVKQMNAESGMNPDATSPKGAKGVAQFMPGTAADRGLTNPENPVAALRAGAKYMADLTKKYGGDTEKALAAYNAGPGNVDKAIAKAGENWKTALPAETKGYLQKISGSKSPATKQAAIAANPFATPAATPAASPATAAPAGAQPPAPPSTNGKVIGRVSPKPVVMSANQEKALEFNDKASSALDRFEGAFKAKRAAQGNKPKGGAMAQLGDKATAFKNQALYNHGFASGDKFFDETANLSSILKAMSAQAYIPGVRNKHVMDELQAHVMDPGKDTDEQIQTKINNLRKTLGEHKEAIAGMMDVKQAIKSGKTTPGDAIRNGAAKQEAKPASGEVMVAAPDGSKHYFKDQASADAFKKDARI